MKPAWMVLSGLMLLALSSCADRYLDRPTPPGNPVPPPMYGASEPVVQPIPRLAPESGAFPAPAVQPMDMAYQRTDDGMLRSQREPAHAEPGLVIPSSGCFKSSYEKAEKPRIAIFLNRTLSDEVRQWRTARRHVASGDGQISGIVKSPGVTAEYAAARGAAAGSADRTQIVAAGEQARLTVTDPAVVGSISAQGDISVYDQSYLEEQTRNNLREQSMWAFENGFIKPFLYNGVNLVDRSTILRLTALDNGQGSAYDPIAPKAVETKALIEHADLFIEILITEHPADNPLGYEFKAVVKEVRTGRIRAMETSSTWDWRELTAGEREVVATNSGYEIAETVQIPTVAEVSEKLAYDVMNALCVQWQ